MITMNTKQMGLPISLLDGDYPDFTKRWYAEIATFFVMPNIFIILFPFAEFFMNYTLRAVRLW